MNKTIEFDQIQDAVYENPDIPKYFFAQSGWYYISTNADNIYRIETSKEFKLDENGEPIGYLDKIKIRP